MGNFEKLVVVVVLFLSAVVLAVSLRGGGEEGDPKNPLEAAGVSPDSGAVNPTVGEANAPAVTDGGTQGQAPGYLLDAGAPKADPKSALPPAIGAEAANAAPSTASGAPRILTTTHGLAPSALDDFMVYTAAEGDTWAALADRFYANPAYLSNLREANEGMDDALHAGAVILVPVFDFHTGGEAAGTAPGNAPLAAAPTSADMGRSTGTSGAKPLGSASTYEVKDGDNLSKISKAVYGTTMRWTEIYEANRDQLASPDKLKVGMKLQIPAAPTGAVAALAASKPAATPKTGKPAADKPTVAKPEATEKKRKVQ